MSAQEVLTLCQALAEEFAAVLNVKRPRVRTWIRGRHRCGVIKNGGHIHLSGNSRGLICLNMRKVGNRDVDGIRRLIAHEVSHLKFRTLHRHYNVRFVAAERELLMHTVKTPVYPVAKQIYLDRFLQGCEGL